MNEIDGYDGETLQSHMITATDNGQGITIMKCINHVTHFNLAAPKFPLNAQCTCKSFYGILSLSGETGKK